jgi:PAS domain S-box-containing protein
LKIGYKLSLAFVAVLIPLTVVYYAITLYHQKEDVENSVQENLDYIENTFHNLEERDTKILSATLEAIVRDPSFKKVYLEKDREKLFDFGQPLFQKLKNKYGITHFYFILPDGHCFVRLHNKEIYGDLITRFTFWEAEETKRMSSGIELGKTAFALRVVSPYYNDGELIGYVELGEEIEHFVEILKSETGNEYGILADKINLDREKWKSVRKTAGLRDNWDDLENHVLLTTTTTGPAASACFVEENLEMVENGEKLLQRIDSGDRCFVCGGLEIVDAGKRHAGAILSLIDITDRVAMARKSNSVTLGLIAVLFAIASGIGVFVSRFISRPVSEFQRAAAEIAEGKLDKTVSITTKDEIGQLADTFNKMTRTLKESHTGLKQQVEDRKKAEEFISSILNSVGEGIIVVDPEYRIISANKAYCERIGWALDDVKGVHCFEASHHNKRPCFEEGEDCPIKHTFETGEPATSLHVHRDVKGNPIDVEVRSYPLKDPSGETISAIEVVTDISEKRKLEEQLRQSQKMEAIGTLTGGIAHDFNNLLTTIIGYGEFLQDELEKDDPMRSYVDMILASGEKAAKLTQSLLAFSRKQLLHPVEMDINESIRKAEALLSRLIGEDIEIKLTLSDKPLIVRADSVMIEQVLMNLATNARDAMPDGGSFIISTEPREFDKHFIESHGYGKPGWYALVCIADTGKGMDEKTKAQMFEPFFTTKDVGMGTGLGLSVVYGIVKQHEGHITVYSEPGQGTTLKIYFPLVTVAGKEEEMPAAPAPAKGGTETVLVAEDDQSVRGLIKATLEKSGYTVLEAADGEDAINVFKENKDVIEALLFDVIMPKKNGIEAYQAIKALRPDIKVLFVSGYPAGVIEKFRLDEDVAFVSKPVSPTELLRNLRDTLNNQE